MTQDFIFFAASEKGRSEEFSAYISKMIHLGMLMGAERPSYDP